MHKNLIGMAVALGLGVAVCAAQAPANGNAAKPNVQINIQGGARGARGRRGPAPAARRGPGQALSFPQFTRKLASPAVLAAGKQLYSAHCATCHAEDLRGTNRGINLLEAQVDLLDEHGELIKPILHGEKTTLGTHPATTLTDPQIVDVAEYIHSVQAQMEMQGRAPNALQIPTGLDLLVGNPRAGKAFFDTHCSTCHQGDPGNLAGIGAKYPNIRTLQNTWVEGRATSGGFFGRGGAQGGGTATVTLTNGKTYTGKLLSDDGFVVAIQMPNGTRRSFDRSYNVKSVVVNNPADAHKKMMVTMTDAQLHNVTAYLASLK